MNSRSAAQLGFQRDDSAVTLRSLFRDRGDILFCRRPLFALASQSQLQPNWSPPSGAPGGSGMSRYLRDESAIISASSVSRAAIGAR